jgi:hypothetical protein
MIDNLQEFEEFRTKLMEKVKKDKNRNDKHVRLISDCSEFLFKNKHFEECISLEKWLHLKHFQGSYLCPFSKSLFDQFPYCYYLFKVFHSEDVVVDSHGNILLDFVKTSEHQSHLISYMMKRKDVYTVELKQQ